MSSIALYPNRKPISVTFGYFFLAVILATIAIYIPWDELRNLPFVDRRNYLAYFKYEENILDYVKLDHWYNYLTNEVLWHTAIPYLIKNQGIQPVIIFNSISFFCIFTFAFFVARYKNIYAVLLLINPLLITLSFDQMRSALSFSLLLWAFMLPRKLFFVSIAIAAITPLIHTSCALFIAIYAGLISLSRLYSKRIINRKMVITVLVMVGLLMSFAFGSLMHTVLEAMGDRRANRVLVDASEGVKYTLFWILFLGFCLFQGKNFYRNIICNYAVIILSFVSFNLIFGGYSLRFLATGLPFFCVTMFELDKTSQKIVIPIFIVYAIAQWYYWLHAGHIDLT